ncbi:hypothetical protein ACFQ1S_11520, partial [Kibdelosporangium lantanae]
MKAAAEAKPYRQVPGPKGKWLIGDVIEYDRDPLSWLQRTRTEFGDAVRLAPEVVILYHPRAAHDVLEQAQQTRLFAGRNQPAVLPAVVPGRSSRHWAGVGGA